LPLASIPTLVTSTESKAANIEAVRAAGANFYSAKPVGREDLARTMAIFCGVPR
jgi:two-component system, chemotaxis family, chemotaxis protein CheY